MTLGRRKSERPQQVLGAPAVGCSLPSWSEFTSSSSVLWASAAREVWKAELCPFSLEDDVKRMKMGSSGLETTDFEGVMSSALLKPNLISGITWLGDGVGLEKKADFSLSSSFTPLFVSGTALGLMAVPILSNRSGFSVVKEATGSSVPNSASGNTL